MFLVPLDHSRKSHIQQLVWNGLDGISRKRQMFGHRGYTQSTFRFSNAKEYNLHSKILGFLNSFCQIVIA